MRARTLVLFVFVACLASAAAIDGNWTSEITVKGSKKSGGQNQTVSVILNLKADGGQITGTVVTSGRRRPQTAQITTGKLDGNSFSFVTVQTTKRGEQRMEWRGTVAGDSLQGTRSREGRRRGQSFTAKRS